MGERNDASVGCTLGLENNQSFLEPIDTNSRGTKYQSCAAIDEKRLSEIGKVDVLVVNNFLIEPARTY